MMNKKMKKAISLLAVTSMLGTTVVAPLSILPKSASAATATVTWTLVGTGVYTSEKWTSNTKTIQVKITTAFAQKYGYISSTGIGTKFTRPTSGEIIFTLTFTPLAANTTVNLGGNATGTGGYPNVFSFKVAGDSTANNAAIAAVNALFSTKYTVLAPTTDRAAVDSAQALVELVTSPTIQPELQGYINKAIELLKAQEALADVARQAEAQTAIQDLFNNRDVTGTIKDITTSQAIENAQKLVDAVTDPVKKAELQAQLDAAAEQLVDRIAEEQAEATRQEQADAAVKALFTNDNVNADIKVTTDQAAITAAENLVNTITNPAKKAELQANIDEAKSQLAAKEQAVADELARQEAAAKAVQGLFNNNDVSGAIKTVTDANAIASAQALINSVTDTAKKAELQAQLDEAKSQLAAREIAEAEAAAEAARQEAAVNDVKALFNNNDVTGTIKTVTDAGAIADAQIVVNAVKDASKKAELQAQLDEAKSQLAAREAAAAEKARQDAASAEVKALFANNDVTGTIKATTGLTAVESAQNLVDAVTDVAKKAELQSQLDEAKRQLEDRDGEAAVERARQEAAATEIKALFNNNDVTGTIKTVTDAQAIANAQQRVDAVTDTAKKAELQGQLDEAKAQLAAREAEKARQDAAAAEVKALFNNNDVTGTIKATTDDQTIASAQQRVDAVTDTAKKAELQAQLDAAKQQLADQKAAEQAENARQALAETAVKDLFNSGNVNGTIKIVTDAAAITAAETLVNAITNPAKKAELQANIVEAKRQLAANELAASEEAARQAAATASVKELFNNNDVTGTIKTTTDTKAIADAQKLVDAITNPTEKAAVQAQLDEAKAQLVARDAATAEKARQDAAAAEVKALFNNNDVTGTIKTTTTDQTIASAQQRIDAVTDTAKKAELQAQLDEAKQQLSDQKAAEQAENARQALAETAVKDLFNSGNVNGTIKIVTDAAAITAAEALVNEITNPAKKAELQANIVEAKRQLAANELAASEEVARQEAAAASVKELFNNNDVTGTIKTTTDDKAIADAQKLVDAITNPTEKATVQAQLDEAKRQLAEQKANIQQAEQARQDAATKAVDDLFRSNAHLALKDTTTQLDVDQAKILIEAITDPAVKRALETELAKATDFLADRAAAEKAVNDLFTTTDHTAIKTTTTQTTINRAEAAVNKLPSGDLRDALLAEIDKAQAMLDQAAATLAESNAYVTINSSNRTLLTTESVQLDAITTSKLGVTWTSSNPAIASIDATGKVVGLSAGKTVITATLANGKNSSIEIHVYVSEAEATAAVNKLFANDAHTATATDITQQKINDAKKLVNGIEDVVTKQALLKEIEKAEQMVADQLVAAEQARQDAASDAVKNLVDATNNIKPTTDAAAIADAQKLVDAVTDTAKKAELQAQLDDVAKQLAEREAAEKATQAVQALFDANAVINNTTDEAAIAAAQALVNEVKDAAKKAELQTQLDEATKQLVARQASEAATQTVADLFASDNTIKPTTDEAAILAAQEVINALTDEMKKAELQTQLDEATKQLIERQEAEKAEAERLAAEKAAKEAVNALFQGNNPTNDIATTLTQDAINQAKELVAAVTDPATKATLEASIAKAQTQLDAIIPIVGQAKKYTLGDLYISGTYTGAATGMSVDVNGKRYYGGTVENGVLKFYGLDKIAKVGDVVTVNLYNSNKQIKTSFPVQVVEPLKVTLADYKIGDNYLQATYNNSDVTQVGIVVDGKKYWGGDVANGNIKFYALDKIKSADSVVTMNYYDANNNLLASKTLKIQAAYTGEVATADLKLTDTNIKGTLTGDVKQVAISVNGKMYYGGTIATNGTYKFYTLDKKITAMDEVIVYGYSPDNKKIAEKVVTISE
ncbi:toxin Cry1Ac domain D-VI-related protein [Listeria grandensis]|uniref:toxin Cry1Ac domain D-VI-related protein n=1 Tax=Listeria grandensis TaxID=1494963 RepID=UPI00164D4C05|nr:toxin Cry1Ac domain D-VI-related protein [Listeria grandensis]MBC6315255.1 hypothetical protein [Listeria grandensis]